MLGKYPAPPACPTGPPWAAPPALRTSEGCAALWEALRAELGRPGLRVFGSLEWVEVFTCG